MEKQAKIDRINRAKCLKFWAFHLKVKAWGGLSSNIERQALKRSRALQVFMFHEESVQPRLLKECFNGLREVYLSSVEVLREVNSRAGAKDRQLIALVFR